MSTPAAEYEAAYKMRRERYLGKLERYRGHILKHETKIKHLTDQKQMRSEKKKVHEAKVKIDIASQKFVAAERERKTDVWRQLADVANKYLEEADSSVRVIGYKEPEDE